MKRDMDIVRQILLALESAPIEHKRLSNQSSLVGLFPSETLDAYQFLLMSAGFLIPGESSRIRGISWAGYDWLDQNRAQASEKKRKMRVGIVS